MPAPDIVIRTYSIQGIQCSKCLKVLKNLKNEVVGLDDVVIDMSRQVLRARTLEGFESDSFVGKTQSLGFQAKEVTGQVGDEESAGWSKNRLLARLGVAGALAGNIMLMSYGTYLGAPKDFASVFSVLSGLLFLPVLFYCAQPFFSASWQSLRLKKPSMDLPLGFAIATGSLLSYLNLARGSSHIYFDSLAALVFLILASRYIVQRFQIHYLSPISIQDLLPSQSVLKINGESEVSVDGKDLRSGDVFQLESGQVIPVDGQCMSPSALIDNSLVTGEADGVEVKKWAPVFAGAKCLSARTLIKALSDQESSRIAGIVEKLNLSLDKDDKLTAITDRFATLFVVFVFIVGATFFSFYGFVDFDGAMARVLALLVIACPCALAVTTPIVLRLSFKKLLNANYLVKSTDAFEKMSRVRSVIFDKTGTLTYANGENDHWSPRRPNPEEANIIYSLEHLSSHPVAQSLKRSVDALKPKLLAIDEFQETVGKGVEGRIDGTLYALKRSSDKSATVGLFKAGNKILDYIYSPSLRPEVVGEIQNLKAQGLEIFLVTGDNQSNGQKIAEQAGISESNVFSNISPEKKGEIVQNLSRSQAVAFVGDGMNDALAMSSAMLGISMQNSVDTTFRTSDIHILRHGISGLSKAFKASRDILQTLKILLAISFAYNIGFGALALLGFINPFIASFLMPLSSLSLLGLGAFMTRGRLT